MRRVLMLIILLSVSLFACEQPRNQKDKVSTASPAQTSAPQKASTIKVELAPFDRFPYDSKFPLVFRFDGPLAPADKGAPANFENIRLNPPRPGSWRWDSDSQLTFMPLDPWKPKEPLEVTLAGLKTSDGTTGVGPLFYPSTFQVELPAATVALSRCELEIRHRAPLIQVPVIGLRFNYPPSNEMGAYWNLKFSRDGNDELLAASSPAPGNGRMSFEIAGPKIFRPETPATVSFQLKAGLPMGSGAPLDKGTDCQIALSPETWDALAEKKEEKKKEIPLAELAVFPPTLSIDSAEDTRDALRIRFRKPYASSYVDHGKARGVLIESGLSFTPPIEGIWKTDLSDDSALVFVPKNPWPIGLSAMVNVDPAAFPAVQLRTPQIAFETPKLISRVSNAILYTDPTDPSKRSVTAELYFSHQPKAGEIERLFSMKMRVEPNKTFDGAKRLKFNVKPDEKLRRKFYLVSENIALPNEPGEVLLALDAGLLAADGGTPMKDRTINSVNIPSKRDVFRINLASISVVKTPEQDLKRVLSIETTESVGQDALAGNIELYVLPDCKEKKNKKLCKDSDSFAQESRVFPEVLAAAEKLSVAALPRDEAAAPHLFNFGFEAPGKREVFLKITKGLVSDTKYALSQDYRMVYFTEEFPKQLNIMHSGSLLSLTGDKNLGVSLRNVAKVKYELARIVSRDVHHFVSATYGNFSKPGFNFYSFGLDQLAERFHYFEGFPEREPGKTVYTSVDFSRFMGNGSAPKGLFLLTVTEDKDEKQEEVKEETTDEGEEGEEAEVSEGEGEGEGEAECEEGYDEETGQYTSCDSTPKILEDKRLVLLTDLGILVKNTLSGEHEVFVVSFRTGEPVAGANVKLLGQNGVPLFSATTKADGRAKFPVTKDLKQEKVPLVYVVEKEEDYSFLPFERNDRQLNFSRFDTTGVTNSDEAEGLRALVFSDRGIYRPGEEARFGIMVRKRNLELPGEKLPLEIAVTDPRGVEIERKKFKISKLGLDDYRWSTENALTGTYTLGIYLVRTDSEDGPALLGSTSFRVDEFQPDKLSVKASYVDSNPSKPNAWFSQSGSFEAVVLNLFGTPAVANKVQGTLLVRPWDGTFAEFPDYRFYTPRADSSLPEQSESLGELNTDGEGKVVFTPDVSRFDEKAFRLEFAAEAFEKDSGRSVVATSNALVADASRFLGWKADGSLDYISKAAGRKVSLISVGSDLKPVPLNDLKVELEETKMVSVLIKQPNGTLSYELTPKKSILKTESLSIPESGAEMTLATENPGDFLLKIYDSSGSMINSIHYTVHGEGNTTFMADRKAEVGIRLSRNSLLPGEELELSINTPYTGFGLITIERDKVYASKWFKTSNTSSVQTITVPGDVIGNAYVSVAFVRALDSKDIFASPLSYGVKPFTIARSHYTEGIKLDVPEKVKPGTSLQVHYKLDDKAKLLLYAVDEGILQFARYKNPDPVQSFIPKRALEVDTYQILDLILPDHKIVDSLSSTGGDEDVGLGKFKNPFARKRRAPMAFWSGIIGEGGLEGNVNIPIPEYFNGTVRILAIAVSEKKVGIQAGKAVAQHDFVIDPQIPYFVSPGDEFEVGATVANTVKGSGKDVKLQIAVSTTPGLELAEGAKPLELSVPEGQDKSFRLRFRAKDALGEQEIRFRAQGISRESSASDSLSIRPPQVFRTALQAGVYRPDKDGAKAEKSFNLTRDLFSQERDVTASISESPLSVARALIAYLKDYPYGCTEQLVSAAFPAVLFGTDPEMGLEEKDVERFTKRAFQTLSSRQRADGSFNLWDGVADSDVLFSVYATHFLLEAKERSLEIPETVYNRAMQWLKDFDSEPRYDAYSQLAVAYGLYLRARSGEVVSKDALALMSDLDRQWQNKWRDTALALFLAGTFKQLQMDQEAEALLKRPPEIWKSEMAWPLSEPEFYGTVYAYISAKHFGEDKALSPLDAVIPVARMIEENEFSSFNSAFSILGLKAINDKLVLAGGEGLSISAAKDEKEFVALDLFGQAVRKAQIPEGNKLTRYTGHDGKIFFYELSESGFDHTQAKPIASGLTIKRELKNTKGENVTSVPLNDKLEVTLFIKADEAIDNVAVVELVPGGFEIDLSDEGLASRKSLHEGPDTWQPQFVEVQEDRIIFYGNLPADSRSFTYRLKPLSRGKFTLAGPYAEGMYDTKKRFLDSTSTVEVK